MFVVNIVKEPRNVETEIQYQFSVLATDITATAPDDYTLVVRVPEQVLLFIEPQTQQVLISVRILDDALIEEIETFQLELFVAEQPHFRLGSITRVTVTIIDDDKREDEGREGWRERGRDGEGRRKTEMKEGASEGGREGKGREGE